MILMWNYFPIDMEAPLVAIIVLILPQLVLVAAWYQSIFNMVVVLVLKAVRVWCGMSHRWSHSSWTSRCSSW